MDLETEHDPVLTPLSECVKYVLRMQLAVWDQRGSAVGAKDGK